MQPVLITTKNVSPNPVHGEVYSIQHCVIKFVSDFQFSSPNKTDRHDIAEILLTLNTISQTRMYLNVTHIIYLLKKSLKLRKGNKKLSIEVGHTKQCLIKKNMKRQKMVNQTLHRKIKI
jgi:hypothetical protein